MPDSTHPPAARVGVALTIGGDAKHAAHVVTDPAGVATVTGLLTDLSGGGDGVTVEIVAVIGRTGGSRAQVRRYTVPASAVAELVERTLELDR